CWSASLCSTAVALSIPHSAALPAACCSPIAEQPVAIRRQCSGSGAHRKMAHCLQLGASILQPLRPPPRLLSRGLDPYAVLDCVPQDKLLQIVRWAAAFLLGPLLRQRLN